MTDVIDDSVSWEERRELRRKKRQELLAEADRLVRKTEKSTTTSKLIHERTELEDDEEFERERLRRRREREERRRKEREELEKQLKEEEEMKAERDRRREERRKQREAEENKHQQKEGNDLNIKSSHTTTIGTEEVETFPDQTNEMLHTSVTKENVELIPLENSHDEIDEGGDDEYDNESNNLKDSETFAVVCKPIKNDMSDEEERISENKQNLELQQSTQYDLPLKLVKENADDDAESVEERQKQLEERKTLRRIKQQEDELKEQEAATIREAKYQEQLCLEREERERRRANAETKRQEYRKQLSQSDGNDFDSVVPLSQKHLASPLVSKKSVIASDEELNLSDLVSHSSELLSDEDIISHEMDEKNTSRKVAPPVPRRTQSAKVLASYLKSNKNVQTEEIVSISPTRPLKRKNQTRRSLDAMEKQAGELYDFLSDLETKKTTCNNKDFISFLSDTSKSDSFLNKPTALTERGKRTSVKERAKLFLKPDIKEEAFEPDSKSNSTDHASVSKKNYGLHNMNNNKTVGQADVNSITVHQGLTIHRKIQLSNSNTPCDSGEVVLKSADKPNFDLVCPCSNALLHDNVEHGVGSSSTAVDKSNNLYHAEVHSRKQHEKEHSGINLNDGVKVAVDSALNCNESILTDRGSQRMDNPTNGENCFLYNLEEEDQIKSNIMVEQLSRQIQDSPKSSKATNVPKVGSLTSKLEKYTQQASMQETKKSVETSSKGHHVSDRRGKWERGEVHVADKVTRKEVAPAGDISSRKKIWETGNVGAMREKQIREVAEVKGTDFSSRKNQWLKVSQKESFTRKHDSPVGIKTGVLSRLDRWEKGEVGGSTFSDKPKTNTKISSSLDVGDRRARWESIGVETSKTSAPNTDGTDNVLSTSALGPESDINEDVLQPVINCENEQVNSGASDDDEVCEKVLSDDE
ncbi:unnamed protein product [Clavelina lepadiformis]|uniref:Uncharacterized protein n=1 Tax=Clavelina lepadiformis TaxID=159417 RepID=A0ABP0GA26_CLALP